MSSVHKAKLSKAHHYDNPESTDCYVSVEGDATYSVADSICGSYDGTNYGTSCPKAGDEAVADCASNVPSYVATSQTCVLPFDTTCQQIATGAYGCVKGLLGMKASIPVAPVVPVEAL
ncbi:hypothetical protein THRCLA_22638 [Thraustotheca clavata]|uniref:Carbohydrate-binding protein n=1 Tax=Thraustotheca clavata TaxID=74557 RepID=A0A1V9YV64_9STRA|nr:hypothetical protein THRCLA_22638 [Thraustotheca clavata]